MKGVSIAAIEVNRDINSCSIRHQARYNGVEFLRKVSTVSLWQINLMPQSTDSLHLYSLITFIVQHKRKHIYYRKIAKSKFIKKKTNALLRTSTSTDVDIKLKLHSD